MTIRKILELIKIIESQIGVNNFSQNLQDYIVTIQNNQNNLVLMKELINKTIEEIVKLQENNIHVMLEKVLIQNSKPFTSLNFLEQLTNLKTENYSDPGSQYNSSIGILTALQLKLNEDLNELEKLRNTLTPYLSKNYSELQQDDNAIFTIIFNNENSIKNLNSLSSEMKSWNTGLYIYQQLISEETPKSFEIIEIDQGSIEVVLNLLFNVGEKLIELFKLGIEVYGSYLTYKTLVHEHLIKSYRGNEKLINGEESREHELLENVRNAIKEELKIQVLGNTSQESLDKKIDVITQLITDHIIKGNNIKLLSVPPNKEEILEIEKEKEIIFIKNAQNFSKLDEGTKQKLIEKFTTKPTEENENSI